MPGPGRKESPVHSCSLRVLCRHRGRKGKGRRGKGRQGTAPGAPRPAGLGLRRTIHPWDMGKHLALNLHCILLLQENYISWIHRGWKHLQGTMCNLQPSGLFFGCWTQHRFETGMQGLAITLPGVMGCVLQPVSAPRDCVGQHSRDCQPQLARDHPAKLPLNIWEQGYPGVINIKSQVN